jgi:hypothetical protein
MRSHHFLGPPVSQKEKEKEEGKRKRKRRRRRKRKRKRKKKKKKKKKKKESAQKCLTLDTTRADAQTRTTNGPLGTRGAATMRAAQRSFRTLRTTFLRDPRA